jgi:DNA-binding NtrC family response regulator
MLKGTYLPPDRSENTMTRPDTTSSAAAHDRDPARRADSRDAPRAEPGAAVKRPVVLAVEDEPTLGDLLCLRLKMVGFDVRLARDGAEAVTVCMRHGSEIAIALIDKHLPDRDGLATVATIRAIAPGVRCCIMSGDHVGYTEAELAQMGITAAFSKPFDIAAVAATLWQLAGFSP